MTDQHNVGGDLIRISPIQLCAHNLAQYRRMFDLAPVLISQRVLDVNAGFSSFNLEFASIGGQAVSCDPLYKLSYDEILTCFSELKAKMRATFDCSPHAFNWNGFGSAEEVLMERERIATFFLDDYPAGMKEFRYQYKLLEAFKSRDSSNDGFEKGAFDLALCSHAFFEQEMTVIDAQRMIARLCDLAGEVRIFPLLNNQGELSELLPELMQQLQDKKFGVEVREVDFEFQKSANAMLRVWLKECEVGH